MTTVAGGIGHVSPEEKNMGLDTTHDCWHGAYSAFARWREEIAKVAGFPTLHLMEGFYAPQWDQRARDAAQANPELDPPLSWEPYKDDVLVELLSHSDCDGSLPSGICAALADRLEALIPLLPPTPDAGHIGDWRDKTQRFVDGLRCAARAGEDVEFH